ncbi:ABC transporter permease [Mariprofundus ferrooxydans]|uniref:Regulatory protein RecX n=1 Tax=Mariprofundus ferrooxydans PV-1 TaxID=314345 RepID=Q0F3T7_9PROT|nr:regulatory protein RecX [Mariprofundus ferrooxydans]EAU55854.1 Regulatory protein RecX [Mariprofundus ferrooxydans PV-1]KON48137.1 ABC transporter permease [Mariprofundus ferrooxydans]
MTLREHCAVELRRKLADRAYATGVIEVVLARLVDDGYLSESRFAESFLRSRLRKGETPRVAAMKARQKGVDEAALQLALDEAEASFDSDQACRSILKRRDPQGLRHGDERLWQKHARFLQNKGFDAATIVRVMNDDKHDQFDD